MGGIEREKRERERERERDRETESTSNIYLAQILSHKETSELLARGGHI